MFLNPKTSPPSAKVTVPAEVAEISCPTPTTVRVAGGTLTMAVDSEVWSVESRQQLNEEHPELYHNANAGGVDFRETNKSAAK